MTMYDVMMHALGASEMSRSRIHEKNFFRVVSPEKVFAVIVKENGVVFGWAFQGKGEAGEHVLCEYGIDANECNLRFFHGVSTEADWCEAKSAIEKCYRDYLEWTKDELLALIKEKRKAFIQRFTARLKPLGFRKKSNHWLRTIGEKYVFEVDAQKSMYSDEYYVNLSITPQEFKGTYLICFHSRIPFGGGYIVDWQLTPGEEIERVLDSMMGEYVIPAVEGNLTELGQLDRIQKNCHCKRIHCPDCWVEKNYWENCGVPEP